jgi:hypothetical protein
MDFSHIQKEESPLLYHFFTRDEPPLATANEFISTFIKF